MKKHEVTKWLMIMKASLNSFPEVSKAKKIEALREAIRLLKNDESEKTSSSEIPNKSEISTSLDCVDRHAVDMLAYRYLKEPTDNHVAFYEDFLDLPSVTPQEPKIVPIAEIKFDEDKLKELVDKAVLTVSQSGVTEVLDKIRAEIENHCGLTKENHCRYCSYCNNVMGVREILEIIDKHRTESEDKE